MIGVSTSLHRQNNAVGDLMRHLRRPPALLSNTISYLTLWIWQSTASSDPLKLAMIVWKHLYHGSSIDWSYRRRYNVVGDLMRHLRRPPALLSNTISYLTLWIWQSTASSDPLKLAMIDRKHLYHGLSILWSYRRYYFVVGDLMRSNLTRPLGVLINISYLALWIWQSTGCSGRLHLTLFLCQHLYHGLSMDWSYQRRYNVSGDLMRANFGWQRALLYTLAHHIVCNVVNMTINSLCGPL